MGHGHEKVVCADCGAVIMQCRCMEGAKNVRKVAGPCAQCPKPAAAPPQGDRP